MKLFQSILVSGVLTTRIFALEAAEITALSAKFSAAKGDEQYQARIELDRLVDQATQPGKGDPAAVSRILVEAIQAPGTGLEAKKYFLRALCRVGTADAVSALAPLLSGPEALIREEARFALASIPGPQAGEMLVTALAKAVDPRDKLALINLLGTRKAESAVPVLAPLVVDSDPATAAAAISALAGIGGPPAAAALNQALTSGKLAPPLRAAVETAVIVASPADVKVLTEIYLKTTSDEVKTPAFIALMKASPAAAKPALVSGALNSPSGDLRREAIARGIQSGEPAIQSAIAGLSASLAKEDRLVLIANAHLLKPVETAEKMVLGFLSSDDEEERVTALAALGRMGSKPAFEAVLQALGAPEPPVNQAAANALATIPYPAAETHLLALLNGAPGPDRILAIKAVTSRNLDGAGGILRQMIKGDDEPASKEAMKSLYFIATFDDLKLLCADALAAKDEATKRTLSSLCKRIASRLQTADALELVKPLG